jgi:ATP synthase F1 complex assembly factor 1
MVALARKYPNFVVPLPRDIAGEPATSNADAPAFEMFYLQWLFHPTPSQTPASTSEGYRETPRQPIATVLFTPLAEFKNASEWAQPQLVLTHYPDLHNNPVPSTVQPPPGEAQHHPLILMRGEISPAAGTSSVIASALPGANLSLTQAQAQLLALALQRFYCSDVAPVGESAAARKEREERGKSLRDFRERPAEWDWKGLVRLAYAGVV